MCQYRPLLRRKSQLKKNLKERNTILADQIGNINVIDSLINCAINIHSIA
jgi:hypothetical protein